MYEEIRKYLDERNVCLVAVSKTKPVEMILDFYKQGQKVFGENRAREMQDKAHLLPNDIEWHMIGHLQKNKVKYVAGFVKMIQSVDSFSLLKTINKEARKNNRTIDVLLQMKIAREESKFGLSMEEALAILKDKSFNDLNNIRVCGVMGMATFTDEEDQVREEFRLLKSYFEELRSVHFQESDHFKEISMGMSGDYRIAIEEGSTMVRIGSLIFGARN